MMLMSKKKGLLICFYSLHSVEFCLKAHGFLVYCMFALFEALMLFIVTVSAIILIFMGLLIVITKWRFVHAFTSLHSKTAVCFFFPDVLSYFMNAVVLTGGLDPFWSPKLLYLQLTCRLFKHWPTGSQFSSWHPCGGQVLFSVPAHEWYSTIASGVAQANPVPSTPSAFLQACTPHVRAPYGSSAQL